MRINAIRFASRSQFLRHNAIFLAGSVAVGALNYLYYPVLGRLVSPDVFGEIQTLVTMFLQIGVFLTVLSMVIVNIVANRSDNAQASIFVYEFERLALLASVGFLMLSIVFGRQIQAWLNFESPWPFILLALAIGASVPFYIRGAYLRGRQQFGLVSGGNIIASGAKLILSAVLVVAGLGTAGAIGGVVLAQILACVMVVWWAARAGLRQVEHGKKIGWPNLGLLAPELRYGGIVLAASLAITLQYSIDIIIVKHYFDATTAGLYAGIAAVARILFFVTASIAQVLISKVKQHGDHQQNQQILHKSLVLLSVISLPVLAATVFLPTQIIGLLMGGAYTSLSGLLPELSVSVFFVAVTNLVVSYYLALRRYGIALLTAAGAGLTYLLISLHHGSPSAVVESLLIGNAATIALLGVWKLKERG